MIGRVVGTYQIVEKLGEGGMGTVYRAVDQMVERQVAIKVLRPDIARNAELYERFRTEAVALARLNHPSIATLYSFFPQDNELFMAMEFVPGDTLERLLKQTGALPWQKAVEYLLWILEAVRHAHQMGILHRDLKPANIMLTPDGRVKVTDFGIARVLSSEGQTREARVVGTLEYLAPERALGHPADARSDIYSLGVVFYEMLSGRLPFRADSDFAMLRAQVEVAPPSPRELGIHLPALIEATLMRALAKDPNHRFPDAATFAAQFREAVRSTGFQFSAPARASVAPSPKAAQKAPAGNQALLLTAAVGGFVFLVVAALGGWYYVDTRQRAEAAAKAAAAVAALPPPVETPRFEPIAPPVIIPSAPIEVAPPPPAAAKISLPPARAVILAALEPPGPITYPSIRKAVAFGPTSHGTISDAVLARGVNFRPDAQQTAALHTAGASDALIQVIVNSYRGPVAPAPAPAPVAAVPEPVKTFTPPPVAEEPKPRSPQRLSDIKRLYVKPVEKALDEHIVSELRSQLGDRTEIVTSLAKADAVLDLKINDQEGSVVGAAGRVFGLKNKTTVTARITARGDGRALWRSEVGDKQAFAGALGDSAHRLAGRIAKQLRSDWK